MKIIGLGIGVLLFSILFQLCSSGLDLASLIMGGIGLLVVIFGVVKKTDTH